jgi:hypothetical protein
MTGPTQRFEELDPEDGKLIEAHYAVLRQRAQIARDIERLGAKARQDRHQRRLRAMGDDIAAALRRVSEVDANQRPDAARLMKQIRERTDASRAVLSTMPPPLTVAADSRLVATLHAYYVYEVDRNTGEFVRDAFGSPLLFRTTLKSVGTGLGIFDDGATSDLEVNWLMKFVPPESRFYDLYTTTGYFGDLTLQSDDSSLDSLVVHAYFRTRTSVAPSGSPSASHTEFDLQNDNINQFWTLGAPTEGSESQLHIRTYLNADQPVTVVFTHELYTYARGQPTYAQIDFGDDVLELGKQLGPVWCYVF